MLTLVNKEKHKLVTSSLLLTDEDAQILAQGQEILNNLDALRDQNVKRAHAELKETRKLGFRRGKQDFADESTIELAKLAQQYDAALETYKSDLEARLVDVAFAVCENIIGSMDDKQIIQRLCNTLINDSQVKEITTLSVSEGNYKEISNELTSIFSCPVIALRIDASLSHKECLLEWQGGRVHLNLHNQMAALRGLVAHSHISAGPVCKDVTSPDLDMPPSDIDMPFPDLAGQHREE